MVFEKNNTLSTINLLKACSEENVKRVVYSASSSAYGNAINLPSKEEDKVEKSIGSKYFVNSNNSIRRRLKSMIDNNNTVSSFLVPLLEKSY